jgi:hypothetical protein
LEVIVLLKVRDGLTADESGQTIDEPLCLKVMLFSRAILDSTSDQVRNLLHACNLAISKSRMCRLIYNTNSANSIFVHIMDRDRGEEVDHLVVMMIVLREITYDASGAVGNNVGSVDDMSLNQAQAQHLYLALNLPVNAKPLLPI